MADQETWLMRPVGTMCRYESLVDGTLDLYDIAVMNEKLDVDDENRYRIQDWMKKNG